MCAATGLEWEPVSCATHEACVPCDDDDPLCGPVLGEGAARCAGPCDPSSTPSHRGCSFVTVWMPWGRIDSPQPQSLVVTNPDPERTATVTLLQIPNGTREEVVVGEAQSIAPGASIDFEIDDPPFISASSLLRTGGVWRIAADLPVVVEQQAFAHDTGTVQRWLGASMLLLPEASFQGDFVVASASPKRDFFVAESYFVVVALEDDTEVTWHSPVPTAGNGAPIPPLEADESATLQLNRFDQLAVHARLLPEDPLAPLDLTGAVISTNKAVAAFSGVPCATPQSASKSCDPIFEQLIPIDYWGREVAVGTLYDRSTAQRSEAQYLRIISGDAGVRVREITGQATFDVEFDARGDVAELQLPPDQGAVLRGDGPFTVLRYLESWEFQPPGSGTSTELSHGDAALEQIVPTEQWLDAYDVRVDARWDTVVLHVVRYAGGAPVTVAGSELSGWVPFGDYESTQWPLPNLSATVQARSTQPFALGVHAHGAKAATGQPDTVVDASGSHPAGLGVASLTVP